MQMEQPINKGQWRVLTEMIFFTSNTFDHWDIKHFT